MMVFPVVSAIAAAVAAGSVLILGRFFRNQKQSWSAMVDQQTKGVLDITKDHQQGNMLQPLEDLPPPVQRYLRKTLGVNSSAEIKQMQSLRFEQEGTFRLGGDKWVPFTAHQVCSIAYPGFVWAAEMTMPIPLLGSLPINVIDSYVNGTGTLWAKLMRTFTLAHSTDSNGTTAEGEAMRWLAEATLYPTSLVPRKDGILAWIHKGQTSAVARLVIGSHRVVAIEYHFNKENDLIDSIHAMRPMTEAVVAPWEGHITEYDEHNGVILPKSMEVGWWQNGKLELYFKCRNKNFRFVNSAKRAATTQIEQCTVTLSSLLQRHIPVD